MRRLLEALDVDYEQWRVLTRTLLRMDLRITGFGGPQGQATAKAQMTPFMRYFTLGFVYLIFGVFMAIMVFVLDDLMVSASIAITYVMFMVGLMVLVDHQSVITSPDDYFVLGPRPVSSRTYFAVRVTNVLVYSLALTTLYGLFPMLAFGVAHGFHPMRWPAAFLAFYLATTLTTLTLVMTYASLIRIVGAGRLARIMSLVQVIMGVLMYAGYMLPSQLAKYHGVTSNLTMPASPWALLFPPTWFASYIAMASGAIGWRQIVPAAASIVGLLLVARELNGRLSMDYVSRLGALASSTASTSAGPSMRHKRPWLFRTGEHRIVSLLVRAQFRHDQKFRMAVLGVLPLTIMYMFMAFQDGPPADPFGGSARHMMSWTPLSMAVLFFPMMLKTTLMTSDAHRASWVYFGTPVSRARILRAQTDVLMAVFIVPYICIVGVVMGYFTGHLAGVITHVVFLGLTSRLLLQIVTAGSPVMPFSRPNQKLARTGGFMGWMLVGMIGGLAIGPLLVLLVYPSVVRIVVVALLLIAASVVLDHLTRARLGERAEQLEFAE